jgi:hypothetical protein
MSPLEWRTFLLSGTRTAKLATDAVHPNFAADRAFRKTRTSHGG